MGVDFWRLEEPTLSYIVGLLALQVVAREVFKRYGPFKDDAALFVHQVKRTEGGARFEKARMVTPLTVSLRLDFNLWNATKRQVRAAFRAHVCVRARACSFLVYGRAAPSCVKADLVSVGLWGALYWLRAAATAWHIGRVPSGGSQVIAGVFLRGGRVPRFFACHCSACLPASRCLCAVLCHSCAPWSASRTAPSGACTTGSGRRVPLKTGSTALPSVLSSSERCPTAAVCRHVCCSRSRRRQRVGRFTFWVSPFPAFALCDRSPSVEVGDRDYSGRLCRRNKQQHQRHLHCT